MSTIWEQLLGTEVRCERVGGVRTRSIRAGSGDAVILLHGTGSTAEAFARNIIPLSKSFEVHALDLLGHGLTGATAEPLSLDGFVAHVLAYMDAAGIPRAHLVGNSLGGWIALWIALGHPERVHKVVNVVSPHLAVPLDEAARRRADDAAARLRSLSGRFAADPTRETLRDRLAYTFYDPEHQLTDELLEVRWRLHQLSDGGRKVGALLGNPGSENLLTPERLSAVRAPALFLWTDCNPATSPAVGASAAAHLPNGRFVTMTHCAVWPQWEDAPTFNRVVGSFLRA